MFDLPVLDQDRGRDSGRERERDRESVRDTTRNNDGKLITKVSVRKKERERGRNIQYGIDVWSRRPFQISRTETISCDFVLFVVLSLFFSFMYWWFF